MSDTTISQKTIAETLTKAYHTAKNLMGSDASNQFAIFQNEEKGYNPNSNHGRMMEELFQKISAKGVSVEQINTLGEQKITAAKEAFKR